MIPYVRWRSFLYPIFVNCNEGYLIQIRPLPRNPRFLLFQANPYSKDYELFLSQVDYKRLSEDLSKIVNMKGKISLGSFVAPVKKRWIVSNLSDLWKVQKNL